MIHHKYIIIRPMCALGTIFVALLSIVAITIACEVSDIDEYVNVAKEEET